MKLLPFPWTNLCYKVAIPILYKLYFVVSPTCAFRPHTTLENSIPFKNIPALTAFCFMLFSLAHTVAPVAAHGAWCWRRDFRLWLHSFKLPFSHAAAFSLPHRTNPKAIEISTVTPHPDFDSLAHSPNPHICQCFLEIFTFSPNRSELGVILPVL